MQNTAYNPVSRPISLTQSTESAVYGLFAVAMGLTVFGVYIGMHFIESIMSSGIHILFLVIELGIILTARMWMDKSPLNYLLFGALPIFSGLMITPFILSVLTGYANGGTILVNALSATGFMAASAAVFAKTTKLNLGVMGKALFFAVIGLIGFGLLQFFVPALRTTQMEMMISGIGIVVFALFTAYDIQRISKLGKVGANPFMLAISLYLDIFNLFLYILRFMLMISGNRR
jgi:modulator of FtsH protease